MESMGRRAPPGHEAAEGPMPPGLGPTSISQPLAAPQHPRGQVKLFHICRNYVALNHVDCGSYCTPLFIYSHGVPHSTLLRSVGQSYARFIRRRGSYFKYGRSAAATLLASSTVSNDKISPPLFLVLASCSTMPESFVSVTTATPSVMRTRRALFANTTLRACLEFLSRLKKLSSAPLSPLGVLTRTERSEERREGKECRSRWS